MSQKPPASGAAAADQVSGAAPSAPRAQSQSEARFRALTESARDAILEIGPDSRLYYISPRFRDILGYPPEEIEGKAFLSFIHPEDRAEAESVYSATLGENRPLELFARFRHHDDSWVWLEVGGQPFASEAGAVHCVLQCRDVGDRLQHVREIQFQRRAESRVGELARQFVGLGSDELEPAIRATLEAAALMIDADRGYLISFVRSGSEPLRAIEWNAEGIPPRDYSFSGDDAKRHAWVWKKLVAGELVALSRHLEFPSEANRLAEDLDAFGIKSYLAIPVRCEEGLLGIMGFHSLRKERSWTEKEITFLRLVAEVITSALQRQRSEQKLRASEARFRALAENAHDAIVEIGADRKILYVNPGFRRMTGYTEEELIGLDAFHLLVPEETQGFAQDWYEGAEDARVPVVCRLQHMDGSIRWAEATQNNLFGDHSGKRFGFVVRDVTDRELGRQSFEARQALDRYISELSRRFLSLGAEEIDDAIQESLPQLANLAGADAAWLMHIERTVLGPNIEYHWYGPLEPRGGSQDGNEWAVGFEWAHELLRVGDIIHIPCLHELPKNAYEELNFMKRFGLVSFLGVPLIARSKLIGILGFDMMEEEKRWSEENIALLRLAGELFLSALQRKSAETALQESNRRLLQSQKMEAIGTLAGGIAHDFNNQLSVIIGNARFISKSLEGEEEWEYAEPMMDLERAGEHCARLTRSLLAFSRHSPQPMRLLQLDRLFSEVKELLGPLVPASIKFTMLMPEQELYILADPIQLHQVIINLVVNARDAMSNGGELEISTSGYVIDESGAQGLGLEVAGEFIEIAVRDTGVGMDESTQARIFDPFFTTKDQGKGTGLGLAMIYGIVREAGGVVNVDSVPGEGTTFRIVLPRAAAAERDVIALDSGEVLGGNETILVVEDEAPVRRLVMRILEQHGYRVLEAKDGISALDVCEMHAGAFDALITDVVMPRLGGVPLAKQLLENNPDLKVLFHSGYSADSIDLPGSRFIQKPFAEDDLLQVLRELLDA